MSADSGFALSDGVDEVVGAGDLLLEIAFGLFVVLRVQILVKVLIVGVNF